ncbi:MAG TPA: NAD-dependent epimerase/dehydratase family protein [Bacteroidia bacterium]|jgi:CDP-paratose 2-epimerase|nr:NAD-dependent epimerase/dehydratase family protein [Bacteroidia bacterium]
MRVVIITGSNGLIGSEAVKFFHARGFMIIGIDNDMRKYFFGPEASTLKNKIRFEKDLPHYRHCDTDIRNTEQINQVFSEYSSSISCVVHTAAQPSHDWAAREPLTDFTINANGTLNILEATRKYCPEAVFIFTSTNKVYGDTPNFLPLVELETRWELSPENPFYKRGIDESMRIDNSKHSLFGVSKLAADVLVQEYGKYFGMKTGVFRGGCLTGPAHNGAELHGFLAYLIKCAVHNRPYTIFGYKGKQVRDNIHSFDLLNAFWLFYQNAKPGEVYNMGGSRHSNISMLEAIHLIEKLAGYRLQYSISPEARIGDHIWYVSDVQKFKDHYPAFEFTYTMEQTIAEMITAAESDLQHPQ